MRAMQGKSNIGYTESLVLDSVTTDCDVVPNDWTSRASGDVINLERLSCGKGARGIVKAAVNTATLRAGG